MSREAVWTEMHSTEKISGSSATDNSSSAEPRSRSELRGITGADLSFGTGWGSKKRPECSLAW